MTMQGGSTSPGILTIPTGMPVPDFLGTGANTAVAKVYMIWAIVPEDPEVPWLIAAMDEDSINENEDGWEEEITKAERLYGARFIRITETSVNYDGVIQAFKVVTI